MTVDSVPTGYRSNAAGGDQESTLLRAPRGAFIARVVSVEVANGTHVVYFATKAHARIQQGYVLMPFVSPDGFGFLAGIEKNTKCLVVSSSIEGEYFVVGFFSPDPEGLYAGPAVHQGDMHLATRAGAVISVLSSGDINIQAHELCGMSFFREDQKVSSVDRTADHKHSGGVESWAEADADTPNHDEGDTWRILEVRRKRGEKPTLRHTYGNIKDSDNNELVSQREVLDTTGKQLLLEELQADGTITIKHPGGARFVLKADGNVFVEPKDGGGIYMNDPNETAKGAARIGDSTQGHDHGVVITRAGPFVATVQVLTNTDTIKDGSTVVKVG